MLASLIFLNKKSMGFLIALLDVKMELQKFPLMARRCALIMVIFIANMSNGYAQETNQDQDAVRQILTAYHKALTKGNMTSIEQYVVTDSHFAMIEGKHTNWGWADYRDNHLKPELDGLSKVDFSLDFKGVYISGNMAYASFIYGLSPKGDPSKNYGSGRATAVLIKNDDVWKIQHFHTS